MDPTEGSVVDRWFYVILGFVGSCILAKRHFNLTLTLRENGWLAILFSFMILSILWSDYPMVSLKRVIKSLCAVVMALVVLTESDLLESIIAVLRRGAYILIPFSIVLIRYFRDIGLIWNWSGSAVDWCGVATSKNTLGQIAMTGALIFLWERMRNLQRKEGRNIDYIYIFMSLYLLKGSDDSISMTSLSVFFLGLTVFWGLNFFKARPEKIKPFFVLFCCAIFGVLLTVILHTLIQFSQDSMMGMIIKAMGRDMTLTDRTFIWSDVFHVASQSPFLGVGYGAFWIGRLVNIPWADKMSWTLGQAHNGYVDTYLQVGWVGLFFLAMLILSASPRILRSFSTDFEYGRFRMTFFVVTLFVNITESTFLRGDHNMWFVFLLAALTVPTTALVTEGTPLSVKNKVRPLTCGTTHSYTEAQRAHR